MNFITRPPSSLSFFSLVSFTASLAIESRPRMIAFSKFFLKSFLEPRKLGLAKLRREKYSERSFWGEEMSLRDLRFRRCNTHLDRRPRQYDTATDVEAIDSLKRLRLCYVLASFSQQEAFPTAAHQSFSIGDLRRIAKVQFCIATSTR